MWPIDYNEQFKKEWRVEETNFDPTKFDDKAVSAFKAKVAELFSTKKEEVENLQIRYCYKMAVNNHRVYVGTVSAMKAFLRNRPEIQDQMGIVELTAVGFDARWVDGNEKEREKSFRFPPPDTEIVLYTQERWERGACFVLWDQFQQSNMSSCRIPEESKDGITTYNGFTEHAYRLVFDYVGGLPAGCKPPAQLSTELPDGTVESEEDLVYGVSWGRGCVNCGP